MRNATKRIIAISLVLVSILMLAVPVFADYSIAKGSTAYIGQKEARLREKKSKTSTCLATLYKGDAVKIVNTTYEYHGWYKVEYSGITGFIREDYIVRNNPNPSTPSQPSTPGYEKTYGPEKECYAVGPTDKYIKKSKYLPNIANDLRAWAAWWNENHTNNKITATEMISFDNLAGNTFDVFYNSATHTFQEKNGLTSDGIIGPKTKSKLWSWRNSH